MKTTLLLIALALGVTGCENPAKNKPNAGVAAPVETSSIAPASAEKYALNGSNTKVSWLGSKVTGKHNGNFEKLSGTLELVPDALEKSRIVLDIETASITSDNADLTKHLKSPDFFDVEKFPKTTLTSTSLSKDSLTGNLDLHGVTKSITVPITVNVGAEKVTAKSEFVLKRKDFNIVYPGKPNDLIRDEVVVTISIDVPRSKS
jgi:polyisoprenoid-binding protein YceI